MTEIEKEIESENKKIDKEYIIMLDYIAMRREMLDEPSKMYELDNEEYKIVVEMESALRRLIRIRRQRL